MGEHRLAREARTPDDRSVRSDEPDQRLERVLKTPNDTASTVEPRTALEALWRDADLPVDALGTIALPGDGPVLPSSFAVAVAAQASLGAAAGAELPRVNSARLPNVEAIADTSRGKRSTHLDLREPAGRDGRRALVREAHVLQRGYRPGGLDALGFGPAALAALRPGLVCVSPSACGHAGPRAGRRGFDSLVQTATGFNDAETRAAGAAQRKALPVRILDFSAGWLMAFGALAALHRQATEGGSRHVRVSLAGTGRWARGLGRVADGLATPAPAFEDLRKTADSGFGRPDAIRHTVRHHGVPTRWTRPSMPPGAHPPSWAGFA